MATVIVACLDIDEPGFVELARRCAGSSVVLRFVSSAQADLERALVGVECLLATDVTAETLARASDARLIQVPQVGHNGIDLEAARGRGIAVCNAPGVNTAAVAEHSLMLILACARMLREHDEGTRQGRWPMMEFFDRNLPDFSGATLGIVGFGAIGQALSAFARPLAGEVLYHQRQPVRSTLEAELGVSYAELEELLKRSDAVSLHVPLTDATRGMIGARELGWMKPTAVLVNTSRGSVVDEAALIRALSEGGLLAAGLDVFVDEPLSARSPLTSLPNVLLTPHMAGGSRHVVESAFALSFENIERLGRGDDLINRVDTAAMVTR